MPKTIRFNQFFERETSNDTYSKQSLGIKSITRNKVLTTVFSALITLGIIAITILSYYSESIYFTNIIVGLSIVGLILLIKTTSEQKTSIKRVKK
tara:strand:+ start:21809 stop:22093 length:285 start_codon:yes stop_codon:yes gene_type:complete